jgi:hypothetical protein
MLVSSSPGTMGDEGGESCGVTVIMITGSVTHIGCIFYTWHLR